MVVKIGEPPIRTVLMGLGNIGLLYDLGNVTSKSGSHYLTHAKTLCASEHFDLVAALDLKEKNRKIFSDTYRLPAFSQLQELAKFLPIDLLVVALPTEIQVRECLDLAGAFIPRNLLIEKPVGISSLEARNLLDWARTNGVTVFVNYFRNRFNSTILARNALANINFGEIEKLKISSYGSLRNIYSHFLDLSEYLLPGKVICGCSEIEIQFSSASSLMARCDNCSRLYEFEGINSERRETFVEITSESNQIRILNNGLDIYIKFSHDGITRSFCTDSEEYNRYQYIVYETMYADIVSKRSINDLNRAILIQEFLDGIE